MPQTHHCLVAGVAREVIFCCFSARDLAIYEGDLNKTAV
jgi:hypothetical protein